METFHVYVVGSKDPSIDGLARVAEAIAAHYGLAPDDLLGRLTRGRFRVKTGVDRATADQYHRDLDKLGARVAIEPASASDRPSGSSLPPPNRPVAARTSTSSLPPPMPGVGAPQRPTPLPPRAGAPSTPPMPSAAIAPPTNPPNVPRTTTPQPASGLSAAFSGEVHHQDLSAFDNLGKIALSSLDGVQDSPIESSQYSSPQFGPPMDLAKPTASSPARPSKPRDVPVEQDFRPPGAEDEDMKVEIAPDELEHRARRRTPVSAQAMNTSATPVGSGSMAMPPPGGRTSAPSIQPPPGAPSTFAQRALRPSQAGIAGAVVRPQSKLGPLADERVRFVVGVVLALALAFIPAHLIAGSWERSSYHGIDARLEHEQESAIESPEAYATLDTVRDHALGDKKDSRRDIAIVGMLVWLAAAGGLGYVWFRRIPWDRLE